MTLSAMLLAGGHSRRMGAEKATLLIAGQPLWQRQLGILNALQTKSLWISAQAPLPWCPSDLEMVLDQPPSRGPLSGVAAGLRHLQTSHLLVLAVDLPQMTTEHLQTLCHLAGPGCGVIPLNNDYLEPLCAIYPVEAAAIADEALAHGTASLQDFGQKLLSHSFAKTHALSSHEKLLYLNMNTPLDVPKEVGKT